MDKIQYEMLLELSKEDIKELKKIEATIQELNRLKTTLVSNLTARMKANGITTLGSAKLISNENLATFELIDLKNIVLSNDILDKIVITIDIDKTVKNLQKHEFTDAHIEPLVNFIKRNLGQKTERLIVSENPIVGK